MARKKILMAACNYWTSPFQVGSHQIARGFVDAGWDVAFIASPISPLHFLGDRDDELEARYASYKSGGEKDLAGHLWEYVPGALAVPTNKPLLRSGWMYRNWAKLTVPNVIKQVQKAGFGKVDLLYFDNINESFWLDELDYGKAILRVADNNAGFDVTTPARNRLELELARRVDLVIYSAEQLRDYVAAMHPKQMLHVPNGVNFAHFAKGSRELPLDYCDMPRPIAVYVGAMEEWFDFALVNRAAAALPDVSFVLIGSDRLARERLDKSPNLHLLGSRPYSELPKYLHNADVGIIPFDVERYPALVNGIHPLKLYEYLACGLPVVAVDWAELANINSPAVLCKDTEQFIAAIEQAVSSAPDRDALVGYASEADWSKRVSAIIAAIGAT